MRIDGGHFYNQFALPSLSPKQNDGERAAIGIEPGNAQAFAIKDTYESSADQMRTDFGGYDKSGRATPDSGPVGDNPPGSFSTRPVERNNFSTSPTATSSPYGTIMTGLSKVLNTNEDDAVVRIKNAGLAVEDLVNPQAVRNLSENPMLQNRLQDFATDERSSLLAQSGMTSGELDEFVSAVRG